MRVVPSTGFQLSLSTGRKGTPINESEKKPQWFIKKQNAHKPKGEKKKVNNCEILICQTLPQAQTLGQKAQKAREIPTHDMQYKMDKAAAQFPSGLSKAHHCSLSAPRKGKDFLHEP